MQIEVGVLKDDYLQMIAVVNNDGAVIRAKNVPYLVIPYRKDGVMTYIKKKSVSIPARRFMERTVSRHEGRWQTVAEQQLAKLMNGDGSAMMALEMIGHLAVEAMKSEIIRFKVPHNAALTIANKGFDDPLIDTGALRDAIDYRIVPKSI
ncbi:hypothetical protein [Levilactobacillus enshiensis]|uniref:hypothetical protein n=1 Tax=Levilactobacillus enshiensis TaxID=2590213 RepID=UPI00117B02FF|nr:hypothetical protein [Levilactobacillus enshiensis]